MKHKFKEVKFRKAALDLIEVADKALREYRRQGYRVTLRQLYYHFIANDLFPADWIDEEYNAKNGLPPDTKNTVKNYKSFGDLISNARLAGLLDWESIEDRGRQPKQASEFDGIPDLIQAAMDSYRLPRMRDQEVYAELWVEKDALAGVLLPLAYEFHAVLMVNKGYSSQSAMHESARRFMARANLHPLDMNGDLMEGYEMTDEPYDQDKPSKEAVLFYLGDFDPSGEDMVRDIETRLRMFGAHVRVEKVALTMEQIKKYRPPPNPAKVSDPRAKAYIQEHGNKSWEVDALEPSVLQSVIRAAFKGVLDMDLMGDVIAQEERDKAKLREFAESLNYENEDGDV